MIMFVRVENASTAEARDSVGLQNLLEAKSTTLIITEKCQRKCFILLYLNLKGLVVNWICHNGLRALLRFCCP